MEGVLGPQPQGKYKRSLSSKRHWTVATKEFKGTKASHVWRIEKFQYWVAHWVKFNVDGAARKKLGPAGIGGVLRNNAGKQLLIFSTTVRKKFQEAEILAISQEPKIIKEKYACDSIIKMNSKKWAWKGGESWRLAYIIREIWDLCTNMNVVFWTFTKNLIKRHIWCQNIR